jgi:hypothetical protein
MLKAKADALSLAIAAKKALHVEAQLREFKGMAPRTIRHHRARLYKLLQQEVARDGAPREAPPQQPRGEDSLELLNQQGYVVQQRLNGHRGRAHKANKAEAAAIAERVDAVHRETQYRRRWQRIATVSVLSHRVMSLGQATYRYYIRYVRAGKNGKDWRWQGGAWHPTSRIVPPRAPCRALEAMGMSECSNSG